MKKQILGIAIIIFGVLLIFIEYVGGIWIPIIGDLPWDVLGLIAGIVGLVIVVIYSND